MVRMIFTNASINGMTKPNLFKIPSPKRKRLGNIHAYIDNRSLFIVTSKSCETDFMLPETNPLKSKKNLLSEKRDATLKFHEKSAEPKKFKEKYREIHLIY